MTEKNKEQHEDKKLNSRSLLEAYNQVVQTANPEFAQEFGQQRNGYVEEDEDVTDYTSGALMSTYAQVMDSYREGTIDAEMAHPTNERNVRTETNDDPQH